MFFIIYFNIIYISNKQAITTKKHNRKAQWQAFAQLLAIKALDC